MTGTIVLCNREKCQFNNREEQTCAAGQIGIVDLMCISRRRVKREDNYRELMKSDAPIFHRESVNSAKITGRLK